MNNRTGGEKSLRPPLRRLTAARDSGDPIFVRSQAFVTFDFAVDTGIIRFTTLRYQKNVSYLLLSVIRSLSLR